MAVREQMEAIQPTFANIAAVATVSDSHGFADLFPWSESDDSDGYFRALEARIVFGVRIETCNRVVAVEEHNSQLRYFAGGWGNDVYTQPNEMGTFNSVEDAVAFVESFLLKQCHPQSIQIPRDVTHANYRGA